MSEKIDEASQHEAGDRVYVLSSQFDEFIRAHAFIQADPKLRELAETISEELGRLYQAVWQKD